METNVMIDKQILFKEEVKLTGVTGYGFSWQALSEGKPIPEEGARFDIYFEGDVLGESINGKVKGVDYLKIRADRLFDMSLYADVITNDGARIKLIETGFNNNGKLRLNMNFHTADERYQWLNQALVWGVGDVSFETGEAYITAYLI